MTARAAAGSTPPLVVRRLKAWYGRAQILFDVDLEVGDGEVVALMGRNGAGKSTALKSIMGLLDRDRVQGDIWLDGAPIRGEPPYRICRRGLGYVPEDRRVFSELTVLQNLAVGRQPVRAGAPHWTVEGLFKLFPNLAEMPDRPGGRMSGGEQQMLTVARTLMGNPRVLLLDEPSEGVAPVIVERMADAILALKRQGLSVLLSEQNLHFAGLVSDRAYVLEKGQVRFSGSMKALMDDTALRRDYLAV